MATWWTTCTGTSTASCSTTLRRTKTTAASSLEEALRSARGKGEKNYTKTWSWSLIWWRNMIKYGFRWVWVDFHTLCFSPATCLLEVRVTEDTWTWVKMSRRSTCPCRSRWTASSTQTSSPLRTNLPTSRTSIRNKVGFEPRVCLY